MKLEAALPQLKITCKARRLQSLWPAIEAKLAEGVSHAEILNHLNDLGFELTAHTYKSYLYRLRKRRRTTGQRSAQVRLTESATTQSPVVQQAMTLPAAAGVEKHKRPPTFEFNPCGDPSILETGE